MKEEEVLKEMKRFDKEMRKYKMYDALERRFELERMKFERKIELMKGNKENMAEEMDKEKFKKLISEYKKFKMENVRHFRFHPNASPPRLWPPPGWVPTTVFGKFL